MNEAELARLDLPFDQILAQVSQNPTILTSPRGAAQRTFDVANAFYEGGLRCLESVTTEGGKMTSPMVPAIVNFAFAAELFLKSELQADGQPAWGHNLAALIHGVAAIRLAGVA